MPLPLIGVLEASFWVVHLWVSVHPCMRPVSTKNSMEGISPNFDWWCSWGDRQTGWVLKVEESKSRSLQGQKVEWLIVVGRGIHIDAYYLLLFLTIVIYLIVAQCLHLTFHCVHTALYTEVCHTRLTVVFAAVTISAYILASGYVTCSIVTCLYRTLTALLSVHVRH